ncbi:cbb3-type cytochrome c oxidase subunit I [Aquimarina macrocephali]|uniref:cbb3-type cytochrome c oxidase subunit I n=1 Tax=Aquimarina macrocephali TaxID=666563 RepID=UPI000463A1B6|nr:cbb3-type cytochrome c oxidase subunit I [Aquimarina macrocephali]
MNQLFKKPHLIFLLTIPIIMLIGFLSRGAVLDINIHDTYYIIDYFYLATLISILFGIIGLGYWIMQKVNRKLSKWLNWAHIVLTFGGVILVPILNQLYRKEIIEYKFNNNLTLVITVIILLMILGQLIFPINIIYGLIKNRKNQ